MRKTITILSSVLILALALPLILAPSIETTFAQQDEDNGKDKITLRVKIFLQDLERDGFLRITALFNGETLTKDIPFSEIDPAKQTMKVDFKVDAENDLVKGSPPDEYIACVYHVKEHMSDSELTKYDCNEGDMASTSGPTTVSLFKPSSMVYEDSLAFFNANGGPTSQTGDHNEKAIVKLVVPMSDRKNADKIKVMVMLKGQIQSELIDNAKQEISKSKDDTITRTFTFDRQTDAGLIQLGDKFLACVAGDDLSPPEAQECEKRVLKKFDSANSLPVR
ncbi:MAG: hypothetical protein MRJ93_14170 [Nitrososphaeraceae archaeon]|nr:hypothetical protein [Nitrososphaeraceae archaeon]